VTDDNRRANIALEMSEARVHHAKGERYGAEGDRETACNRYYFAALHAARAVCLTRGLEAKSHRGLKHLLSVQFVKQGELPDWVDTVFAQLETERDLADYSTGYRVSEENYERRREGCSRLLETFETYLRDRGWV
jgi:uncharacterized protein (UPF0332 family)